MSCAVMVMCVMAVYDTVVWLLCVGMMRAVWVLLCRWVCVCVSTQCVVLWCWVSCPPTKTCKDHELVVLQPLPLVAITHLLRLRAQLLNTWVIHSVLVVVAVMVMAMVVAVVLVWQFALQDG